MRRTPVKLGSYQASGLRTRYFPRVRILHPLILAAPWLNLALLVFFFHTFGSRFVVQPGYVIDLPRSGVNTGSRPDTAVLVKSVPENRAGARREILFFQDEKYMAADAAQMEAFTQALTRRFQQRGSPCLVVYADEPVRMQTLVDIMKRARSVGIRQVNLATRSLDSDTVAR